MSIIQDFQNSNDNRKDLNTPKINVALPPTQGLKPADMSEVTGAVQPAPSPTPAPTPQPAITAPPSPVVTPQVETPAESVAVSPESPVAPPQVELTQDQQVDQFINQTLDTDMSSTTKNLPSLDGVTYDDVANVQRSDADLQQGNIDIQTQLMMQGKSVASSIEDAYNMGEFQPTLIGGDSMPYLTDQINEGNRVRAGLANNIVAERQEIVEQSFQPKPLPQTETDPTKPRPDTTASFNRQWSSFFNNALTPGQYEPGKGRFGEAGNGIIGGLIYGLGLPQNLAFGLGLDIENTVQRSPLGGVYNKVGDVARSGLQAGLNAIGTFGNFVNSKIGMGQVNTQLPKDFDPVRADPKFKGSYTMNALRGEQFSFSDNSTGKNNPLGIRSDGNNPSFMIGLAADVLLDPAGTLLSVLKPLQQGNRVVRTAGRAAEVAVDPIGQAVFPALGTVTTSIFRNPKPTLPPASSAPTAKPPKQGRKKKASQAGVVTPTNTKPQTINAKPNVDAEPPKGTTLHQAWQQRQVARKAQAQTEQVKRVIIPAPPKDVPKTARQILDNAQAKIQEQVAEKMTVTMPGGKPAVRNIPKPTSAQIAIEDQAGKVQLQPLTPEVLIRKASEEAATRTVAKLPGVKKAPALSPAKAVDTPTPRKVNETPAITNDVLVTPPPSSAKELLDSEISGRVLVDIGDGQVVEGVEAVKVASQTVRRSEAELVRVANREAVVETIAKVTPTTVSKKPLFQLVDTKTITTVVDAVPDETIVREILEEGGLTQPLKLNEVGVNEYELADSSQATLLASAQEAYRRDPRTAEMQNSFVYQKIREPKARTTTQQQKVVEAREVVESIPIEVQPSIIPTVTESVFKGEMTVSEVAEQIANFRPGDIVDASTIKKAKRTTKDLTALMKLVPHPTSGKPLIAANRGDFKTYKDIETFLLKEGIEDPTYFRMFAREGAPIPPGALDGSAFKVITNKPRPFNATPATVVDNTIGRVIAGQLEMPGQLPGVKLDTSVKTSFDPSVIKPIAAANKGNDFRGQLNKQRNALRRQLDEVETPAEMEAVLERIAEIDEELMAPDLKANPGHLQQLQDEVIPDNQHGLSQEVLNLTSQKFKLEREVGDLSDETRRLELELSQQQELLDQAANKVIENTADIGRKELDDDYVPKLPENGVTDQFFMAPDDIKKITHSNGTMYTSIKDAEFFEQNASIVMRALDQVDIPGGVDVVYLTKNMVNDMQAEDLRRLTPFIADVNNAAFYDNKSKKLFIRDVLFDPDMQVNEAVRIITHELGHRLHFRNSDGVKALRQQQRDAILKDGKPVSRYVESVKDNVAVKIDEDFAESVSFYRQQPYKFAENYPARTRVVTEAIEAAQAESLNSRTFYHGTRTPNWEPVVDPLTTEARNVWGQGTYLYSDVARAADEAQAELAVNTPGLVTKEIDMAGTVYEVKPNFERVLRATDKVTPATQRFFADAIEDVIGRKTPEARKAIKAFNTRTSPREVDGKLRYPTDTIKSMYGQMEKYVHKYLGQEGVTLPEETLSDLYRAVNLKIRDAGYDAIFDNELVVVLKQEKLTAINKEALGETDQLDVLVSRFNVDSQLAKDNPASPSAQVNMMESGVRLQKEMVEQTRTKLDAARTEQLQRLQEYQEVNDKLSSAAKREQEAKRLSKVREGKAAEDALNERLSKPNTDPCNF